MPMYVIKYRYAGRACYESHPEGFFSVIAKLDHPEGYVAGTPATARKFATMGDAYSFVTGKYHCREDFPALVLEGGDSVHVLPYAEAPEPGTGVAAATTRPESAPAPPRSALRRFLDAFWAARPNGNGALP